MNTDNKLELHIMVEYTSGGRIGIDRVTHIESDCGEDCTEFANNNCSQHINKKLN